MAKAVAAAKAKAVEADFQLRLQAALLRDAQDLRARAEKFNEESLPIGEAIGNELGRYPQLANLLGISGAPKPSPF